MGGKLKKAPEGARNSVYGEKQCRTFVFLLVFVNLSQAFKGASMLLEANSSNLFMVYSSLFLGVAL